MSQLGAGARGRPGAAAWSRARLWGSAAAPASACPIPLLSAGQRAEDPVQRISSIPWGWCGCVGTEPVFCYVEATAEMPGRLLWGQASQRVSLVPGPRPGGPLGAALPCRQDESAGQAEPPPPGNTSLAVHRTSPSWRLRHVV